MGLFSNQFSNVVEWQEQRDDIMFWKWNNNEIKKGSTLLMIGRIGYDEFAREDVMKPESIVVVKRQRKMDNAPKKRV